MGSRSDRRRLPSAPRYCHGDMEHVDGLVLHPLADRSEFLELSQVDAPHSDTGRHPIFPFVQTAPWCRAHAGHPLHIETTDYKSDGRSDRREAHLKKLRIRPPVKSILRAPLPGDGWRYKDLEESVGMRLQCSCCSRRIWHRVNRCTTERLPMRRSERPDLARFDRSGWHLARRFRK